MDTGHEQKYYQVKDQRYLGEDEFVEKVEGLKKSHEPSYWEPPLENIVGEVIRGAGISRDQLYSLTRGRQGAHGRKSDLRCPVDLMDGDLEFLFPAVINLQRKNVPAAPAIPQGAQIKKIQPLILQDHSIKRGRTQEQGPPVLLNGFQDRIHKGNPLMYVSLLRLYVEVSQQSPLLYIGLIVLLMASWSLIVSAVVDIVIRTFDVAGPE